MPGVLFTNVLMLAGLLALAAPVIIHLLLKRKKRRLPFSTLRFFSQRDDQSSQKRKLRHLLLLAVRLLLFTTLVLAFSRPYLPRTPGPGAGGAARRVVLVLDRSASMMAAGTDGQRWALAGAAVRRVLAELKPEDRAALVSCSGEAEVLSGFAPPAVVATILDGLEPAYGPGSIGKGLKQADKLLAGREKGSAAAIYLVSDLQQNACQDLASFPVSRDIDVRILPSGDLYSPNLALAEVLTDEAADGSKPRVAVANYSAEDALDTPLEFAIDGKAASTGLLSIKAGGVTNLIFPLPVLKPGWHELQTTIRSKDALALDNVRFASLFVPEPLRVLIVEPRKGKRVFEEESFFVAAALDPTLGTTNSVQTPFQITQTKPEEMAARLFVQASQPAFDLVLIPGLKEIPPGCAKQLGEFVRAGGGLVLFLGDQVSANRYNAEFRDLLPAPLAGLEAFPDPGSGWRILDYDTNTAVFATFRLPNSGDLRIPEFTRRFTFSTLPSTGRLAHFDDAQPLLLSRDVAGGRVVLVNTSMDASWSDWPKHKTFVPWLHGLGRHSARGSARDEAREAASLVAGENFEVDLGPGAARRQFKVRFPAGNEMPLRADDQGRLRSAQPAAPGVYSVRDDAGREARRVVANLSPRESDLAAFRPAEVEQQLARAEAAGEDNLLAGLFGSAASQKELWTALLLAALALLFIEPIIANRTTA
jgi:hypothetical protein